MNRTALAVTLVVASLSSLKSAMAADPPRCAAHGDPTSDPPKGQVFVEILSMKPNSSLDPDYLLWDDKSDIFGKVTVDAGGGVESFAVPEIEGDDKPHWTNAYFVTSASAPVGYGVTITVHLEENDWGATLGNDEVDINPSSASNDITLKLDTCAMTVSGDYQGSAEHIVIDSGTNGNQGIFIMRVGMADGRALSVGGDVVLQGFDLIQVLPNVSRLVAGKPTVGLVTVANNTDRDQDVSARLTVRDETNTVIYDAIEHVGVDKLKIGEVRSAYLAASAPFKPTDFFCKESTLHATVSLILDPNAEPPGNPKVDCWLINNSRFDETWEVASTLNFDVTWMRTGHLLGGVGPMSQLEAVRDAAMPYMRAVYPTARIQSHTSSQEFIPVITGGVYNFIAALLAGLGVPADYVTPYAMIMELDATAALNGIDHLLGVLPKDFFASTLYGLHDGMTGLSLGEFMPRAVIFEGETADDGLGTGPSPTLPAHELGHTFGLSVDPTIKGWQCGLPGDLGVIACGMASDFDEYQSSEHPYGVPTWGYWVHQGGGTAPAPADEAQCDSFCFMGGSVTNAYADWGRAKKWIDVADYDTVLDKLSRCEPAPTTTQMYVSGIIAGDESTYLGWTFLQPGAMPRPDFTSDKGGNFVRPYAIAMLDAKGVVLHEAAVPLSFAVPDINLPLEATFFGGYVAFPTGTTKIRVVSRMTGKVLAERVVSSNQPSLTKLTTKARVVGKESYLDIAWSASDKDGDALKHFVQFSPDKGATWWPVAHGLDKPTFSANITNTPKGTYIVRVLSADGVHVASTTGTFTR